MRRLLTEMMGGYLEELEGHSLVPIDIPPISQLPGSRQLPVSPKSSKWTMDRKDKCLTRTYEFSDHGRMCDFIRELLDYEASTDHYGKLLCDFPEVTVSVKTHDVDDVLHYGSAGIADEIY